MHPGISCWLKILVAHLVVDKCLCTPQDLAVPSSEPEPVSASTHAEDSNAERLAITDSSSGQNDIPVNSNSTAHEPPEPSLTQSGPLVASSSGPQERPAPIQTQRNATDVNSSSSISGSSSNSNVPPHPLQLLIDALMQSQSSAQLMGGLLPRIALNTLGEGSAKNSLLHRIGVHALGRTDQLMNQTADTPLPFVLVALSTTPPSVASLANASIMFSKGIHAITPFTLPPIKKITLNSSRAVDSVESVEIVSSTESFEKQSSASTESLEHSTTTKPASIATVPVSRPKLSPKKHQGKKSIEKSSKRRNPTANDAVERRMAMIAKIEKNLDIATSTASSVPVITSSNTPALPTTTPITVIPSVTNDMVDSSSKFKSNIIVSKADIIDAIVATSAKQSGTLESHSNSNTTLTPESTTTSTSMTLDATTSSLSIVSTTTSSTITPSTTPIIETTSASPPVTITSVKKSSTAIPVRSDLVLDVSQLFRRIVHAAVKETTAAAAAARGENIGNIISIKSI